MKALLWAFAVLLALAGATQPARSPAGAATVRVAAPSDAQLAVLQRKARLWEERTGHTVDIVKLSNNTSNNFVQYITWLSSKNSDIDIYKVDNPWVGQLAYHLVDLAPHLGEHREMIPNVLDAYTDAEGYIRALPYTVGTPLLYYRADLLDRHGESVPETWSELTAVAGRVMAAEQRAGNSDMWGYVWQGANYEGLTVNALEWIRSSGGGTIVEPDGTISVDNPRAAEALDRAAGWIGTISPRGQLGYREEDARAIFQLGNSVFMRNWPYAWSLLKTESGSRVSERFAVTQLPFEPPGDSSPVMGGLGYSVSRYSENRQEAVELVLFLTDRSMQRISAAASLPPTFIELYRAPEMVGAFPLLPELAPVARSVVPRPYIQTGVRYPRVSAEVRSKVHAVLQGDMDGADAVERLAAALRRIRGRGW